MNILIIDTATEACSVALEVNGITFNRFEICPQQHSQRILPMVDELLREGNISLAEIDYLGFGQGPGSFTGVRIATGVLQGLALGTGHPVVGVSTLAAMAQQAYVENQSQNVLAAIDARMQEVYCAQYTLNDGVMKLVGQEQVLAPELCSDGINVGNATSGVGTGWAAYPELNSEAHIDVLAQIVYPNALFMLPLAKELINNGQAIDAENIKPVYLRDKVTWKKLPGRE